MTQSIQQEVAAYQKGLENQTAELRSQTLSQRPSPRYSPKEITSPASHFRAVTQMGGSINASGRYTEFTRNPRHNIYGSDGPILGGDDKEPMAGRVHASTSMDELPMQRPVLGFGKVGKMIQTEDHQSLDERRPSMPTILAHKSAQRYNRQSSNQFNPIQVQEAKSKSIGINPMSSRRQNSAQNKLMIKNFIRQNKGG